MQTNAYYPFFFFFFFQNEIPLMASYMTVGKKSLTKILENCRKKPVPKGGPIVYK